MTIGEQIGQVIISGLTMGSIYAIIGIGLAVTYNVTRIFNFCQGEFVMIGGMLSASFYSLGLSLPLSIGLAIGITAIIGAAIWLLFLDRPFARHSPLVTLILITVALSIVVSGGVYIGWGTPFRELPSFANISPIRLGEMIIDPQVPWIWGGLLALVAGLTFLFDHTLLGKGLRACSEQPIGARLTGINPRSMAFFSFILASLTGSIAGVLVTPLTMTSFGVGLGYSIKGLLAAMVGGITKIHGVIVGGMILGLVESLAGGFISSTYMDAAGLAVLIILLLYRPEGILRN